MQKAIEIESFKERLLNAHYLRTR